MRVKTPKCADTNRVCNLLQEVHCGPLAFRRKLPLSFKPGKEQKPALKVRQKL
jgi:hypothetical protein